MKEHRMANLAVLYGSLYGQTQKIAARIADRLRTAGHAVDLRSVDRPPSPGERAAWDAVLIGSWVRGGRYTKPTRRFVSDNLALLARLPSAFFSVSLLQLSTKEESRLHAAQYLSRFIQETAWRPSVTATFAGALPFTRFGWFGKRLMRAIWRREGFDVDLARDYEFTNWEEVDRFADAFAALLPAPAHA
jgi:menaquinone-dependent protoporphyrinogen oxidase